MFEVDELGTLSLADCSWWDEPVEKRPWWAKGDCGGRMGEANYGIVCEDHHNKMKGPHKLDELPGSSNIRQ